MSVEKLEELLKNRPTREKYLLSGPNKGQATSHAAYEEWFENFEREFVAFKKHFILTLEKELRRMWSESDTQMILSVVEEVLKK